MRWVSHQRIAQNVGGLDGRVGKFEIGIEFGIGIGIDID